MAALAPPPNAAGIPLLPMAPSPAVLKDITTAKDYVDRLSASRTMIHPHCATDDDIGAAECYKTAVIFSHAPPTRLVDLNTLAQHTADNVANLAAIVQQTRDDVTNLLAITQQTRDDVANLAAITLQTSGDVTNLVAITQQTGNDIANLMNNVAGLDATTRQIQVDVAHLHGRSDELPVLLANAQAGNQGPLYNPVAMLNGWAPLLMAPNPQTRDELFTFTVVQCTASAINLGLPPLPHGAQVHEQRRQIAARIGVTVG